MLRILVKVVMFVLSSLFAVVWFSESGKQLDTISRITMVLASVICLVLCFLIVYLNF